MLALLLQLCLFVDSPAGRSAKPITFPIELVDENSPLASRITEVVKDDEVVELLEIPEHHGPILGLGRILNSDKIAQFEHVAEDLPIVGAVVEAGFSPKSLVDVPIDVAKVALGPVREANLLLPERLDPFSWPAKTPQERADEQKVKEEFTPAQQQALLGQLGYARNDTPDQLAKWRWQIQGGGNFRQGNTAATNANAQVQTERISTNSNLLAKVGAVYNSSQDLRPNRRFYGETLFDRNLRGRWLAYLREELDSDQAALVDIRTITSVGVGFKFINELKKRWVVRTGPTTSYVRFDATTGKVDEAKGGWMLETEYRVLLGESARFEWTSTAYPDFDNEQQLRTKTDVALLFPIGGVTSRWNWKIGARHFYQFNPVNGAVPNDVEAYFNILFSK